MELLKFEIKIEASPEKVWSVLWDDFSYRQWTSAFCEGSFYKGTLEEDSKVQFLDPDNNGMFSKVVKNIPGKEMIFLHLGEIYSGIETPMDWGDATESWFLEGDEELTSLRLEINSSEEFKSFFEEKIPEAIQNVKNLSENQF
ncbi:SRPBCC domain-containing protein [Chryseobacterium sp.]|uniref:SRPBCC domain-containing protein n=1 Tax=Chryseobacterium sp. TaxID=1871047 RepID=UPI00289A06D7|nr:SRPBCC domain-containing protein [Chryseobacterium sp.]